MSLHEIQNPFLLRPRPEDRRRDAAEPAPLSDGTDPLPPGLRSEAFAEDLPEPVAATRNHFAWQVWHTATMALLKSRKVGLNTVRGRADGTPCGSWQGVHSTS